ncbi:AAA+ ATPase domain-containing protein [Artemisia annua]|uniref:DNA helicase n=1 Tax=Artemisia annua TaxID=35608 RepID=A0A2U1P2Z0_ARTAN|nr:AAA+ ATPase domain-containing protein [Artemisia annua]
MAGMRRYAIQYGETSAMLVMSNNTKLATTIESFSDAGLEMIMVHPESQTELLNTVKLNLNYHILEMFPPALLSRFDLLWLILDKADMGNDLEMANQNRESPALGFAPLEASVLRAYISAARKLSPSIPREMEEYIATAYSSITQEEAKSNTPTSYTTLGMLLALARLRFAETVGQSDVDEALSYSILRDEAARANKMDVSYAQALNRISRMGYTEAQLKECLEEYAALNVWQIHPNSFDIRFIDA